MKLRALFLSLLMLYCLVDSQGSSSSSSSSSSSNSNGNTKNEVVDVEEEFEFEDAATVVQQTPPQQQERPPVKPMEGNATPGISGFFERMVEGSKKNPLMIVLIFVILVKNYLSSGKVKHIEGSLVRHINSISEWNDLMDESKKEGKYVVVDFFATWCPPCRTAAPKFDQLSIDYGKGANVIFCKVDVDKCSSIAKNSGVTAMPTFMIVKDAKEVDKMKGWSEAGLNDLLMRTGAKKGIAAASTIKEE